MPELHWLGDGEAKRAARRVPYRLLTAEKRDRGLVWARLGRPNCRFIMATHASKAGQSVADQIRRAINTP